LIGRAAGPIIDAVSIEERTMRYLYALLLSVAFVAPPAFADQPPGEPPNAAAAETPAKPKLICKSELELGSFIPKKTCRTQQQIDAMRKASQDGLDRSRDGSSASDTAQPTDN
jgi:hypothetical protein